MTQRTVGSGGSAFTTGIWSYALSTLTGFTAGGLYIFDVSDESGTPTAFPPQQERQFQFGQAEGDLGAALTLNTASTPALWSVAGNNDVVNASDALNLLGELLSGSNLMLITSFGNLVPDVTGIYADNAADPGVGGNLTRLDGAYYINGSTITRTSDNASLFSLPYFEGGQSQVAAISGGGTGSGLAFSVPAPGQAGGIAVQAAAGSVESDCAAAVGTLGNLPANVTAVNGHAIPTTGSGANLVPAILTSTQATALTSAASYAESAASEATSAATSAASAAAYASEAYAAISGTATSTQAAAILAALTANPSAVIAALEAAGLLQAVPGASSSSGQTEPTLQFTAQALANVTGAAPVNITSDTITIQS
jgi:hypothetical protein